MSLSRPRSHFPAPGAGYKKKFPSSDWLVVIDLQFRNRFIFTFTIINALLIQESCMSYVYIFPKTLSLNCAKGLHYFRGALATIMAKKNWAVDRKLKKNRPASNIVFSGSHILKKSHVSDSFDLRPFSRAWSWVQQDISFL